MIAYLKGKILAQNLGSVIIEVNNVGYLVFVPEILAQSIKIGQEVELFTYYYLRENVVELYGFFKKTELEFFKQLITINGVGPKAALAILSSLKMEQVKGAIVREEPVLIQTVPGIGKKTAARIVLELKNKIFLSETEADNLSSTATSHQGELVEALINLGYSRAEAAKYCQKIPAEAETLEEKIKFVLKNAGK